MMYDLTDSLRHTKRGLQSSAGDAPGDAREAPPPSSLGPFRRGQVLAGGFQITGVLGAGGMGIVYEAHDQRLDRTVAIKAPLDETYGETLRREALAMAAVHHPNLVGVYTLGQEGDRDFMVMERVFGMTLDDRISEAVESGKPIALEEALVILSAIADALTAVHRAGLAHRDVKANNVMLDGSRVVLADFGLATPEVGVRSNEPIAGSADYMAPELILGLVRPGNGPRVDLYALGVVAFELLTGRCPYQRASSQATLLAHVNDSIPDVHALRRDVPDELAALLQELLAKRPEDRPESSEAVLWRLQGVRARLPRSTPATRPFSVLIVDDDAELGLLLKRRLEWTLPTLEVTSITDSEKAFEKIQRHGPDIALVDLNMPRMNGVELCMNIGALPARSRPLVVAMSAQCSRDDIALLRTLDVHDFVNKDEGFVARMCEVIGDVRRARLPAATRPTSRTR